MMSSSSMLPYTQVALLAEGVDRNYFRAVFLRLSTVALLAEGVDRNFITSWNTSGIYGSPSSRRAWIEIALSGSVFRRLTVALLAEGVDRNSPL